MLNVFRRISRLSKLGRVPLSKNHKLMQVQNSLFSENFEEDLQTYNKSRSQNKPRSFSRVEARDEKDRVNKLNIRSVLFKSNLEDVVNYIKSNEINENNLPDLASILANRLEYEGFYKIKALELYKLPKFTEIIDYFDKNIDNLTPDQYFNYIHYIYTVDSKYIINVKRDQLNRAIEKGKKVFEEIKDYPEIYKTLNLYSILGYYSNIYSKNLLEQNQNQLTSISMNFISKVIRRFANWPKENLKFNSVLRPLLEYYLSSKESESFISKLRIFKNICEIDNKIPLDITSKFIYDIGEEFKINEEFINSDNFEFLLNCLALAKTEKKMVLIKKLHQIFKDSFYGNASINGTKLLRYLVLLSKLDNDVLSNFEGIEPIVSQAINDISPQEKIENVLPLINLIRMKKLDEKEFIAKTFDIVKERIQTLQYNNTLKMYRNSLVKFDTNKLTEIGAHLLEKIGDASSIQDLRKLISNLVLVSNFCKEEDTQNLFNIIKNTLENGKYNNIFLLNFINDWVENKQEFVNYKIKSNINELLLKKIDMEHLKTLNDKNAYRFFLSLNDMSYNMRNPENKKIFIDILNTIKLIPNFKINALRNFSQSISSEIPISNVSFMRTLYMIKEVQQNKEQTIRNVDYALNSILNLILDKKSYNIPSESIQNYMNYIDNISSNLDFKDFRPSSRHFLLFKVISRMQVSCKFLESLVYKYISTSDLNTLNDEKYFQVSELLESSLSLEEKRTLVKIFFNNFKITNDKLEFGRYRIPQVIYILKIIGISNKINPDVVNDNVLINAMKYVKQNLDGMDKFTRFNMIAQLTYFNPKLVNEELKDTLNSNLKDISEDIPIKYILNRVEDLPPSKILHSLHTNLLSIISNRYEAHPQFEKPLFFRVLELLTRNKITRRGFFNKIIDQYGANFDSFTTMENIQIINLFSRIGLVRHDIIESSLVKINLNSLEEHNILNLFNNLSKLDYFRSENQINYLKTILTEIEGLMPKNESNISFENLLNYYYTKTYNKEFYDKTMSLILEKFNSQKERNMSRLRNIAIEILYTIRRLPIYDKFTPELQNSIKTKYESKKSIINNNFIYKLISLGLKQLYHNNIVVFPDDLPCHIYLPEQKICIFLFNSKELNCFEDNPNIFSKVAINECIEKGQVVVYITNSIIKEAIKTNDPMNLISLLEQKGISNLNTEKKYDFSELKKLAYNIEKEAEIEEVVEESENTEKIKI